MSPGCPSMEMSRRIGLVDAGEDSGEGALPGAVLADQRVDFAGDKEKGRRGERRRRRNAWICLPL